MAKESLLKKAVVAGAKLEELKMPNAFNLGNAEDCRELLCQARHDMADKTTTTETGWLNIKVLLAQLLLCGHEDVVTLAESTLLEMEMREPYMWKIWNEQT